MRDQGPSIRKSWQSRVRQTQREKQRQKTGAERRHAAQELTEEEELDDPQMKRQNYPETSDTSRRRSEMQAYSRREHEIGYDASR